MEIKKYKSLFYIVFLQLILYLNYKIFIILFILFSIRHIYLKHELNVLENIVFKLLPFNYFLNQFLIFLENPKSSIFWDMQNFIHYIQCNTYNFSYEYKLDLIQKDCPITIGYGPLTEFIKLDIRNIWSATIVVAIIFLIFSMIFLFLYKGESIIVVATLISPAFHFLVFSLNSDIFVILFVIYLLSDDKIKFSYSKLMILSLLTQIKLYTIALFVGYSLIFYFRNENKNFYKTIGFLMSNLILLINHYITNSQLIPTPISFTRSFGVLHDYILLKEYIGFDEFLLLSFPCLVLVIFYKNKIINFIKNFHFELENSIYNKILLILPLLILINFYQNWGYKFIFNSFLFLLMFNKASQMLKVFAVITTLISSTYYLIGWGFEEKLLDYTFIIANKINFYLFVSFLLIMSFKLVIQNNKFN